MRKAIGFFLCGLIAACAVGAPPEKWLSVGVGGGGALYAPSFNPHNPDEFYVNCDMGEVFHTTTLGRAWETVHFTRLQTWANAPKIQFTAEPKVRYAIDFTNERRRLVKSGDNGQSWQPLPGDPAGKDAWNVIADATRADRLLVSTYKDLYCSRDGGGTFGAKKFHTDAGSGLHLAGAFFDDDFIAVGTNAGLLISEDGGETFTTAKVGGIREGEAMVSFAGAVAEGKRRFFCVTLGSGDVFPGVQGSDHGCFRGVYALDWGADKWQERTRGIERGEHPFFVSMARNNINVAWLGGSGFSTPVLYKTTDGGHGWRNTFQADGNRNIATGWSGAGGVRDWSYGEFVFGLAVHPADADRVAFTDLGFVHVTTDGGATWRQAYVDPATENIRGARTAQDKDYSGVGLENTSAWHVCWIDKDNLWASFADIRGIRSKDRGRTWNFDYTGQKYNSSYGVVRHPQTGVLYMAASSVHDLYQSTFLTDKRIDKGRGNVLFSLSGGNVWRQLGAFEMPIIWVTLDPKHGNRLYAAAVHSEKGGIYVCNDLDNGRFALWERLAQPPRTEGHPFNLHVLRDGALLCTYSGRRAGKGSKFTASSGVFLSTDEGKTWHDRSHANMYYWTKDVVIDPHDSAQNTWYAAVFSGWGGPPNNKGGLYRTHDRGKSWTRIFDHTRVSSCAINPADRQEMYVTTETGGLWHSENADAQTPLFRQVRSYPFRQPERVFFNPHNQREIWVTSFGNGLRVGIIGE